MIHDSPPHSAPPCPSPTAIASTLGLLNSSESAQLFAPRGRLQDCVRCAVVGNGGILNGSRQGRSIDAHDYVFRYGARAREEAGEELGGERSREGVG